MKPFTLRLYFPSGDPYGLKVAKLGNWSGVGVIFPRALLAEARKRPELGRPGVYLLLGEDEEGFPLLYVGEADDVGKRIAQHDQKKDFWTHAVVFTANANEGLDKAQTRYLEARLIELAKSRGQARLLNQTEGSRPPLSEMDRADAEQFLENLLLTLPPLGVTFLGPEPKQRASKAPVFILVKKGLRARAELHPEGLLVKAGSEAAKDCSSWISPGYRRLREHLIQIGVLALTENQDRYRFTRDHVFPSPSAAADVILCTSVPGPQVWKTEDGKTLKEWLEASSA